MIETLFSLAKQQQDFSIGQAFVEQPNRFEEYSLTAGGLFMDYSKQNITQQVMASLFCWANQQRLTQARDAMFGGDKINHTEGRAVLHTVLRASPEQQQLILGNTLAAQVQDCEQRMAQLIAQIHSGELQGCSGKAFTDVVAVGIGGSYYGPKVCAQALLPYTVKHLKVHYLANVDGDGVNEKLKSLDPETTLVVIISKTFVTQETLLNANVLKHWLLAGGCTSQSIGQHFIAVTTNQELAVTFGVLPARILPMWDWVGGRFSLWSAVGFPLACAIGMDNFRQLKAGALAMDQHFVAAPLEQNMPVIMALLGVWNRSFLGHSSLAVLPYAHSLRDIPAYLQQLDMESNGKCVTNQGRQAALATAPIVFGQEGTNSQHAFMQLMHQSEEVVPCEFIVALQNHSDFSAHHQTMVANCFAQSEALMQGKSLTTVKQELSQAGYSAQQIEQLAPHKVMRGNNPSTTLTIDKVTPHSIGSLMALYEHKIFVQGVMWQLNSFDQWGVELGKSLGNSVLAVFNGGSDKDLSGSSQGLINKFKKVQ